MLNFFRHQREHKAWQKKFDILAPKAGDIAPDFELSDVNGENLVRLIDFQGQKPVALIFGSYTWPPFVKGTVRLSDLCEKYHDRVQFLVIYIREAHPVDGWWLGGGISGRFLTAKSGAATDVYDPKTMEERREVAGRCEAALQYSIPTYVDDIDDTVNKAYAAFPTRLYLVGLDGRVVYAGGLGPFGFKPSELEAAIDKYLATQVKKTSGIK